MTHTNKDFKNEKFRTRLISDDETQYVDTDYTIGELEETLKSVSNRAIIERDPTTLKIASLFAFTTKKFEEVAKERSMYKARFEAFRAAVQEIQQLPSSDIKESLDNLLTVDEGLAPLLSMIAEMP